MRNLLMPALVAVLGLALAHRAQRSADELRFAQSRARVPLHRPEGRALRVAALGQHTALADLMWFRAVLAYADVADGTLVEGKEWLRASFIAVAELDPGWRSVYFYGGGLLRVVGDLDGSDTLFEGGMRALPEDPYFPFALAMNHYLYRQDPARAAELVQQAARLPGAPAWYPAAAAAFLDQQGQRAVAARYIDEQLQTESRPEVRRALEGRKALLAHDELSAQMSQRLGELRQVDPKAGLEALGPLPEDPLGPGWVVGVDGRVRSRVMEGRLAADALSRERALMVPLGAPAF